MQLSKSTSWGLILGGLFTLFGFIAIGLVLGLLEDDIAPADELKAMQDNQLFVGVMTVLIVGLFTYLAKSLLEVAQAIKVPDGWYVYLRMLVIVMLVTLFVAIAPALIVSEKTTADNFVTLSLMGEAVDAIQIIAGGFVYIILAVFALKNGSGNRIFRTLIALLGLFALLDIVGVIGPTSEADDFIEFVVWILWSVCLVGIGIQGLTTKEV